MISSLRLSLAALAAAAAPCVFAHAQLVASVPAQGAALDKPPSALRLTFNERIEPAYTSLSLVDASGRQVAGAKAVADPNDARSATFTMPPLAAGAYSARWIAVGADGHKTHGEFSFSIR
jgi:methionine-rich copper-binding protein CopC